MKSNRDCKIVEDLLPNYIEGLTSEATNYFIEEHIQSCEHCKETLKAMQEQINAEKLDGKEEIDYLKKINRKTKKTERIATISIIISVLLFVTVLIVALPNRLWNLDDDKRINFFQQLFKQEEQTAQWTYYVAEKTIYDKENSLNGEYYKEFNIIQFNERNNNLENHKMITIGIKETTVNKQVETIKSLKNDNINNIENIQCNKNSFSFNKFGSIENKNIDEIIKMLLEYDDDGIIEKY